MIADTLPTSSNADITDLVVVRIKAAESIRPVAKKIPPVGILWEDSLPKTAGA